MDTVTKTSACPLDCPDTCTLSVTVEAESGHFVSLSGDERNPLTAGAICGKVRRIGERLASPVRLAQPWLRARTGKGPGSFPRDFEPATWDAALERITTRFGAIAEEHGAEAILPISYGGSNGALTEGLVDERLWRRLGTARPGRTLCAAPNGAAAQGLYGKMPGADLRDHVHAELIVVWGFNPRVAGMHYVSILAEAQRRGAKLVVIDPRRTSIAKSADLHLAPRPGTDLLLALALVRELFHNGWHDEAFLAAHTRGADELFAAAEPWLPEAAAAATGLAADDIRTLAELYHKSAPAMIRLGWGPERCRNGGSASAAILALPAVAGKFGARGGGFTASMSSSFKLETEATIAAMPVATRTVNLTQLGRGLCAETTPRTAATFVYNCNPLATVPDQVAVARGFAREDLFSVVFDQVATDTVDYADVVLPATTFLEHDELRASYGATFLAHAPAALAPAGEARPNFAVFAELLQRFDLEEPGDLITPAELAAAILVASDLSREQRAALEATGGTPTHAELKSGTAPIPFVDHFPRTDDQRIHLAPASMPGLYQFRSEAEDEAFPLALISPAHLRLTSSTFGECLEGEVGLGMHPSDMAARGLEPGDRVRIFNALGEVVTSVARDREEPRRGTIVLPKGLWARHTQNSYTSNSLIPDHLSDFGGGACYNDARVEVERLP
jgi:anaerobic selenocysteine-containing dehydrogenase